MAIAVARICGRRASMMLVELAREDFVEFAAILVGAA